VIDPKGKVSSAVIQKDIDVPPDQELLRGVWSIPLQSAIKVIGATIL